MKRVKEVDRLKRFQVGRRGGDNDWEKREVGWRQQQKRGSLRDFFFNSFKPFCLFHSLCYILGKHDETGYKSKENAV